MKDTTLIQNWSRTPSSAQFNYKFLPIWTKTASSRPAVSILLHFMRKLFLKEVMTSSLSLSLKATSSLKSLYYKAVIEKERRFDSWAPGTFHHLPSQLLRNLKRWTSNLFIQWMKRFLRVLLNSHTWKRPVGCFWAIKGARLWKLRNKPRQNPFRWRWFPGWHFLNYNASCLLILWLCRWETSNQMKNSNV